MVRDNLTILREEIASDSVDLIYLDPPFNSNANYNVLFRTPSDEAASAQVEAFRDTWTWGNEAQWALDEIILSGGPRSQYYSRTAFCTRRERHDGLSGYDVPTAI